MKNNQNYLAAEIEEMDLAYFMQEALKEAEKAGAAGELPIGAVVVIDGEIIYEDGFGNLISNIRKQDLLDAGIYSDAELTIKEEVIKGVHASYSEVPPGELLMLFSSAGFLEVGCYQQSASDKLKADVGEPIRLSSPAGQESDTDPGTGHHMF